MAVSSTSAQSHGAQMLKSRMPTMSCALSFGLPTLDSTQGHINQCACAFGTPIGVSPALFNQRKP